MKKNLKTYSLLFLLLLTAGINAQNTTPLIQSKLDGTVVDDITNQPIIGASINIKGTTHGVVTDAEGKFYFQTGQKLPYTLIVTYIGYKKLEIIVDKNPVTISLKEERQELDELVVVGYGTQKRKDITGSVASVPKANLSQVTSSADNLLRGAVAGVVVTQSSGRPGASSSVRIRGGNSITAGNEPLYVVDGILIYNDNNNGSAGVSFAGASINVLSTINPADIESIEVLKDASATAIYGSRGSNGVVIITTKKGTKGQDNISYQGYFGFQDVSKKLHLMNASQWASLRNDVQASIGQAPSFTDAQIEAFKTSGGYDWQSAAFRSAAPVQNHQLSFSGGDERSRYAISAGYFDQEGTVIGSDFKRISLRINYEKNYSQNFKFGVNANYSNSISNGVGTNGSGGRTPNPLVSAVLTAPVVPIKNADGSYNVTTNPYATSVNGFVPNPINDLENTINETKINRILTSLFGEYKITKKLTAKIAVSGDVINTKQNYYAPANTTNGAGTKGLASIGDRLVSSVLNENTLNYNTTFGENHKFSALGGYTLQYTQGETVTAGANTFVNDANTYNSIQDGVAVKPYSDAFESVLKSWLARVNYSYKGKYNFTLSARADGSSRFGSESLWGYFPSAGFSWNITDEEFANNIKGVTEAKLRLTAGTTGNQEIGNYLSLASMGSVNYSFGGTLYTGLAPTRLANPDLKWEKTTQYNVGLDLSLLDRKVNFVFDVYYKKTNDLLISVPVPLTSGYASVLQNIGGVENKGIEIGLTTENLKSEHFSWNSNIVFSANRNKVVSIGNGVDQFFPVVPNGSLLQQQPVTVKVGLPLGTFWGYKTNGIFQTQEEINTQPKINSLANTKIGDRKYVDTNGDGAITALDKGNLGTSQPKFVASFSNTVSYRDFDLNFSFQGSYGAKIFNALNQQLEISTLGTNANVTLEDRWTPANPSNEVPRASSSPLGIVSERYVEDASFVRLKLITLGYTLPKSISKKLGAVSVKFYVSAENLVTWTKYTGYDPEVSSYEQNNLYPGIDFGSYPNSKTFISGLNVTF
ncbi:TonB-dependent receptor [Flavobacterium sp. ANB]|uniref:SusC/RagA family TonB-linked outer membrane protein n=1 Tax=unclassified Flavobacterium TaxID=196869 RepID=UPI0012B8ADE5|nr:MULTISPECIES: TonB-dependent receptor [unclassified Flavobacterium]MBF4518286.1 TonB-dependent receptor [Flavobacterium sp. ANB]MTD71017.1 SusC/RagA family TonB-linked outer membrane protein [Flavobacterium sp. LC2016-13]